jgi:hypothetical protein
VRGAGSVTWARSDGRRRRGDRAGEGHDRGPVIYEVNTPVWLGEVARRQGGNGGGNGERAFGLGDVPADEWDRITPPGVDAVWLMGVWERSPAAVRMALESPGQRAAFDHVLPDWQPADVLGSAYSIRRYEADARLGGRDGLARARKALADRGVRLIVDFVPNHVATDHPWLASHPDRFVRGSIDDLARAPDAFLAVDGGLIVARGRDPNFPPWSDVVQLDAFAPGYRAAAIETLLDIAGQADGVRCDMAMLLLDDVFARTWGDRAGPPPGPEFWTEVIGAVRAVRPDFLFVAEVYWDLEWRLHELGFDHSYDKPFYDRLVHGVGPAELRGHLEGGSGRHLLRFLENHDEPRAATVLPPGRERAAAAVLATLPGAVLWHEGQFEGRRVHLPVHLARRPDEPLDEARRSFHLALLAAASEVRQGAWALCPVVGWEGSNTEPLLAWSWTSAAGPGAGARSLVVVNLGDSSATGRIPLPWGDLAGQAWRLDDLATGQVFHRDGDALAAEGLYVELPAWGHHLMTWAPAEVDAAEPSTP